MDASGLRTMGTSIPEGLNHQGFFVDEFERCRRQFFEIDSREIEANAESPITLKLESGA